MKYQLSEDVFYKKINENLVSIIKYNDDDFIYKLESSVAKIFLLLVEGNEVSEIKSKFLTGESALKDSTIDQIIHDLEELAVIKAS